MSDKVLSILRERRAELALIDPEDTTWDGVAQWHARARPLIVEYFAEQLKPFDQLGRPAWSRPSITTLDGRNLDGRDHHQINRRIAANAHAKLMSHVDALIELVGLEDLPGMAETAIDGKQVVILEALAESLGSVDDSPRDEGSAISISTAPLEEPRKIILTWSGRTSHKIALFLHEWWTKVIPAVVPWISSEDIAKGDRWFPELMTHLGKSTTCVICVTPENYRAPWVYYEAGVIASKQERGKICTVLFGVTTANIKDTPLAQFQATEGIKDDFWRLVKSINGRLVEGAQSEPALRRLYEDHWPTLETQINSALSNSIAPTASAENIDLLLEYKLTKEAKELLREGCNDVMGLIYFIQHDAGLEFLANQRPFGEEGSAREQAKWKSGFDQLVARNLVEARDHQSDVFRVTNEGYRVGDAL